MADLKFVLWNTFTAGAVGTLALTLIIRGSRLARVTRMPRFRDLVGSTLSQDRDLVRIAGRVGHFLIGIAVFGPLYGIVFASEDSAAWTVGLATGVVHALLAGLVIVPLISRRGSDVAPGTEEPSPQTAPVLVSPGGLFGIRWGLLTPVVILVAHVAYGVIVALTYDWITPIRTF